MLAFDDTQSHRPEAEEEENYFVSMTDMMVGILFIFIIMLMVFALQFQQQTDNSEGQLEEVLARVEEVAEQLRVLRNNIESELDELSQSQKERTALLTDLERELKAVGLEVQIDPENGVLRLTDNAIRFDSDRSELNAQASDNVQKLSSVMALVLPRYTTCLEDDGVTNCRELRAGGAIDTVFIEGHTDQQGPDDRNWELSTQRAVSTYRLLTESQQGLRTLKNRAGKEILSVSGYSSTRPIPGTETGDVTSSEFSGLLASNRRIDMRFVMEVDNSERLQIVLDLTGDMEDEIEKLRQAVANQ